MAGYRIVVIAMPSMLLAFVRNVEPRKVEWSEFDLDRAEWQIPAKRMKMREPHIVPLSRQVAKSLRDLSTHTGGVGCFLRNHRKPNECMAATTLSRVLEHMGFNGKESIGFSANGFRATARPC